MALPAGILRHRVTIEAATDARNTLGETSQTWTPFLDRWASIEAVSYSEQQQQGQTSGTVTHSVRMRYAPGLTGKMRLRWGGRLLYVSSVIEKGHREEHELQCEERAA